MSSVKLKLVVLCFVIAGSSMSFAKTKNDNLNQLNQNVTKVNEKNIKSEIAENTDESTLKEKTQEKDDNKNDNLEVDGNSEEQSVTKYSQRNDGIIDISALEHKETPDFRIENGSKTRIILKTKNNDIYSAEVVFDGQKKMMRGIGNYSGKEIFVAEIPNVPTSYYFKLTDAKTKYYYGRNTTKDESAVQKFQYTKSKKLTSIPNWARGSVGYQIYIDSFRNGNVDNDPIFNEFGTGIFSEPTGELRSGRSKKELVLAYWGGNDKPEFTLSEWDSNYEDKNDWEENVLNGVQNYTRYYGGDLEGIEEKLDYLKDLGIEYVILSSPFYSLSNHKYDTIYFNHVDPYFGSIEQTGTIKALDIKGKVHNENGDMELNLLTYNPETDKNLLDESLLDTKTWVWTDSDLQLASLLKKAHAKGLRVVIEVAPDTTSNKFFARNGGKYSNWYLKDTVLDLSNPQVRNYIENSLKKWVLGPDETFKKNVYDDGIDGIRYVYYDDKNKEYIADITENLKKYKPDLLITGEFSNSFTKDIEEGVYDSGADYNIVNNVIKYMVNNNINYKIGDVEFASKLNEIYNKYANERFNATQVFFDSLDTDRIFSGIINPNRVYDRNNQSNQGYLNIRPDIYDPLAVSKLKKIIGVHLTLPATPVIYYGDEKGMWGADSPRNRKPMLWDDYAPYENETDQITKYSIDNLRKLSNEIQIDEVQKKISYPVKSNPEIENYYKSLLAIRKKHRELFRNGTFRVLEVYGDPKMKSRTDADINQYLSEEKRKAQTYRNLTINPEWPNLDFLSYEIASGNESMIVVVNNSSSSYPVFLQVPKLFGFYKNELNPKENYSISDRKIKLTLKPNEVKVLYSNDKNMFDSFKKKN